MVKLKTLTKIEQRALEEFKTKLLKNLGDNVVLIKLYGSKARGDYHKESDIDILVVLKKADKKSKSIISELAYEIGAKYNFQIYLSVISLGLKEFKYLTNLQTNYILNVAEEGINLWQSKGLPQI